MVWVLTGVGGRTGSGTLGGSKSHLSGSFLLFTSGEILHNKIAVGHNPQCPLKMSHHFTHKKGHFVPVKSL